MFRTVYALFVGINDYPAPMSALRGCISDVTQMAALLEARVTGANDRFVPLLLTDAQATRQGIIDAWRSHLGQAGPQDVALFHYSGHGSQEHTLPEFAHLEPDGLNETLVCHDSRLPGGWDLADKELAQLIAEVARNGPHLAVILDCCHSGSGTRDSDEMTPRQQMADDRTRPIGTYIVTPEQATALAGGNPVTSAAAMPWASIASGRHVLLAACRPEEKAKETMLGNEHRGVFSYFLQDTLQSAGAVFSYRDLMQRASALLRGRGIDQMPQLEATDPDDLNQPFLGGAIRATPPYFTLRSDSQFGWVIDGGTVHGIPQPSNSESTQLALFSLDTDLGGLHSLVNAIGEAVVQEVMPGQSRVAPRRFDGVELSRNTTYKAVVTASPLQPLAVSFEGDAVAVDGVRQALATANLDGTPSLLMRESDRESAEYFLLAEEERDRFRICRKAEAWPLAVDTPGLASAESAALVALRLEHIARWVRTLELVNKNSGIAPGAVQLEIYCEQADGSLTRLDTASGLRLEYEQMDAGWRGPKLRIRLRNTTADRRFFCMLLDLTETYGICTGLLPRGGVWLEPSQSMPATVLVQGRLREAIDLYIPDELWKQGVTEMRDTLKLIVSTDEADATLLQQDDLPVTLTRPAQRATPGRMNTLSRLMARVHTRNLGAAPRSEEEFADWTTVEFSSTVVRPAEAVTTV